MPSRGILEGDEEGVWVTNSPCGAILVKFIHPDEINLELVLKFVEKLMIVSTLPS